MVSGIACSWRLPCTSRPGAPTCWCLSVARWSGLAPDPEWPAASLSGLPGSCGRPLRPQPPLTVRSPREADADSRSSTSELRVLGLLQAPRRDPPPSFSGDGIPPCRTPRAGSGAQGTPDQLQVQRPLQLRLALEAVTLPPGGRTRPHTWTAGVHAGTNGRAGPCGASGLLGIELNATFPPCLRERHVCF